MIFLLILQVVSFVRGHKMRLFKLILGDIKFQFKYGIYFIYAVIIISYLCILSVLPTDVKNTVGAILVFSDPGAMGMFFMGAILLLEKSQRVLDSISVSPVSSCEYIISKVVSIGIISLLVGLIIAAASGINNLLIVALGILIGSIMFTLLGLMVSANVRSLNQYIIATAPVEIIGFAPPIAYILGFKNRFMLLHPGCILIRFVQGNGRLLLPLTAILLFWLIILFFITRSIISRMFIKIGGVKL